MVVSWWDEEHLWGVLYTAVQSKSFGNQESMASLLGRGFDKQSCKLWLRRIHRAQLFKTLVGSHCDPSSASHFRNEHVSHWRSHAYRDQAKPIVQREGSKRNESGV